MAKTPLQQITSIRTEDEKNGLLEVAKIDVPHTLISNRAKIYDLANDGKMHLGVERILTQEIYEISTESSGNRKKVYGSISDKFDQIRFVGNWYNADNFLGTRAETGTGGSYVEITFYGTDLNLLIAYQSGGSTELDIHVDGAFSKTISETTNNVLVNESYSPNQITPLELNLPLGIHTVRVELTATSVIGYSCYGFDVVNESTTLDVNGGSTFIDNLQVDFTSTSASYDSGFTNEYGTSGTKGGNVIVYRDSEGTLHKDIQWTDVTQNTLTSTDHSNEEIIARYNFREFGAGRSDDLSRIPYTGDNDRRWTLSDNCTAFIAEDSRSNQQLGAEVERDYIRITTTDGFFGFVFVGTGLDLVMANQSTYTLSAMNVYVNGVGVGSLSGTHTREKSVIKICSGLPYGTHYVRIDRDGGPELGIVEFEVYGPKKPKLPSNCVEIGNYFLMAEYTGVDLGSPAIGDSRYTSTGVIRHSCLREALYKGTGWVFGFNNPLYPNGAEVQNGGNGSIIEFTFWGTGFEWRGHNNGGLSNNTTIEVDGVLATAANFPSASFQPGYGNCSYNTATATLDISNATTTACGMAMYDLPLGLHTIRMTNNVAGPLLHGAFDVVTPVHFPKMNGPMMLNMNLRCGNTSVGDSREIVGLRKSLAVSRATNYLDTISVASDYATSMFDQATPIYTETGEIEISASQDAYTSITQNRILFIFVDGKEVTTARVGAYQTGGWNSAQTTNVRLSLEPGYHFIMCFMSTSGGATINCFNRQLIVREVPKKED